MPETRFGDITFAWDDHALAMLLNGPNGDMAGSLARVGVRLETQMKINVTGGGPTGQGPHVRTGRLRASISWQVDQDAAGLYVDAGTNVPYGRWLEQGTDRMRPYPWAQPALETVIGSL